MVKLIGILLLVWVAFIVLGALIHAVFWLLIVGVVALLVTGAIGWAKRETLGRR